MPPFRKGQSGNPAGRKKGVATRLVGELQQAVAADAMTIVKSIIASAKSGDVESRRAFLRKGKKAVQPGLSGG
jgi:hypothetical protein